MKRKRWVLLSATLGLLVGASAVLTACGGSSSGSTRSYIHHSPGYRGYYRRPWGYPPIYVGGGEVDPDWGVEAPGQPIAVPLPEMGMPDFGGGMDMDFGGFDW